MKSTIKYFPLILCILMFSTLITLHAQKSTSSYTKILNEVKKVYGDTCFIGVQSKLIERLYRYKNYPQVKQYLNEFELIKGKINLFRKQYQTTLKNESVILLSLSRIFKSNKEFNIINAAGIYFGADSVTNIALSYFIIKNNITNYNVDILQIGQIDPTFKKELKRYGKDWYYSKKLKQMKNYNIK